MVDIDSLKHWPCRMIITGRGSTRLTESGHAAPGGAAGLIPDAEDSDLQTHSCGQTGGPETPQVNKHTFCQQTYILVFIWVYT